MVFSSPTFLFAFLPITLLASLLVPARLRNACLLVASVVFYVWGAGGAVAALLYVAAVSFVGALVGTTRARLAAVVGLLLLPLVLYKYDPFTDAALPLGISFFTFHAISYVVDARRGVLPRDRRLRDHLLYLFLFPHQIAGPIVRYAEIAGEIRGRRDVTFANVSYGLTRFCWGLAKKACVADSAGLVADAAFGAPGPVSTSTAWIGAVAYTVQIYFDFSGYSDMAIGLAALFGFRFPENFFAPYRCVGPADFWRRWHMTLSRWFRDYVYIPLGGNRHGRRREYLALVATFLLTALWHGATAPFLLWGLVHAGALLAERALGWRTRPVSRVRLRRLVMAVLLVASWVPFRSGSAGQAFSVWSAMFSLRGGAPVPEVLITLTPWTLLALAVGLGSFLGPRDRTTFDLLHTAPPRVGPASADREPIRPVALVTAPLLLVMAVVSVMWLDFSPFLYFQF